MLAGSILSIEFGAAFEATEGLRGPRGVGYSAGADISLRASPSKMNRWNAITSRRHRIGKAQNFLYCPAMAKMIFSKILNSLGFARFPGMVEKASSGPVFDKPMGADALGPKSIGGKTIRH